MFAGQLKQFHGRCQQDYALSGNAFMGRRAQFGTEAHASYVNLNGQETLHLWVRPEIVEEVEKQIVRRRLPNWALARFDIPLPETEHPFLGFTIYARMRGTPFDTAISASGVDDKYNHSFQMLGFAGTDPTRIASNTPPSDTLGLIEAELLIDLRPAQNPVHASGVIVDVFARAYKKGDEELAGWVSEYLPGQDTHVLTWLNNSNSSIADWRQQWDDAGLPENQTSLFIDDREILTGRVTWSRGINSPPPDIHYGTPNFLLPPTQPGYNGWRYTVYTTDPESGLLTSYGMTNLIWWDGDPAEPHGFDAIAISELNIQHYAIEPYYVTPTIPYAARGMVRGMTFYDDPAWMEYAWLFDPWSQNWRWSPFNSDTPDFVTLPTLATNVQWPDTIAYPHADDPAYFIGALVIDVETGGMTFQKAT